MKKNTNSNAEAKKDKEVVDLETDMQSSLFVITYFEEFYNNLKREKEKEQKKVSKGQSPERLFLIEKRSAEILKNLKMEKERYKGMFSKYCKLVGKLPEKKPEGSGPEM